MLLREVAEGAAYMLQGVAVPWMLVIQTTVLKMGGGGVFGDGSAAGYCWEKRDITTLQFTPSMM